MRKVLGIFWAAGLLAGAACAEKKEERPSTTMSTKPASVPAPTTPAVETATFGAGCFWCVEAVYQRLAGVISVESGYSGGATDNPSYDDVCTGTTGHAEVCQIKFDPSKVDYPKLLEVFWKTHDPTTLNRQGNDAGTQYRSVIFTHNERQKELAEKYKKKLDEAGAFPRPIVTEITPFTKFYKAEGHHQDFFNRNPGNGYCRFIIVPKVEKFKAAFGDSLKKE